jgi:hypothetical protein
MKINVREYQRAMINEEANNPEKLATQGTQDEKKQAKKNQHNMCWTPIYANKHK